MHKPPVHVRFDEISSVNFARVQGGGGSSRSFDFEVETKSGATYVFSSIEKLVLAYTVVIVKVNDIRGDLKEEKQPSTGHKAGSLLLFPRFGELTRFHWINQ